MTVQQLLEKFQEIKKITIEVEGSGFSDDEDLLNRIQTICENVEIEYKIESRLKNGQGNQASS